MIKFEIISPEQEKNARRWLLADGIVSMEDLALMPANEVQQAIDSNYEVFTIGLYHWLILKDRLEQLNAIVHRI